MRLISLVPFPSPFVSWKWDLAQTKKAILEEKGRETQGKRTDLLSNVDKKLEQPHNTQAEIAKEVGANFAPSPLRSGQKKCPDLGRQIRAVHFFAT